MNEGDDLLIDISKQILELIRLTSTDLPMDVENALRMATEQEEPGSASYDALQTILENIKLARKSSTPICQDTGTPIFYIEYPFGLCQRDLHSQIIEAVRQATQLTYLRPNSVDPLTGKNSGDNSGDDYYPTIHFTEVDPAGGMDKHPIIIDLMLKGGGCENVGAQYRLPDARLKAGRDLDGVRKVVLDSVFQAQGKGCAPGILGVAIGGDRGSAYAASKKALWRKIDEFSPILELEEVEKRITQEANQLSIGTMGFGGKVTVLGTKITSIQRIPASYFVTISYMCWACRRRRLIWQNETVYYE